MFMRLTICAKNATGEWVTRPAIVNLSLARTIEPVNPDHKGPAQTFVVFGFEQESGEYHIEYVAETCGQIAQMLYNAQSTVYVE